MNDQSGKLRNLLQKIKTNWRCQMKKWFWNLNLRRKIFLLILVVVLAMMLLEMLNRQAAYRTYNQLLYDKNSQIMMTYMDYIENVFERMENVTYLMIADVDLQEKLMYLQEHAEDGQWLSVRSDISDAVNSYANMEEYFSAFLLLTEVEVFGFGNENIGLYDDLDSFTGTVEDANGQIRLISGEQQLTLVREIRQSANLKLSNLAYVVAQVDFQAVIRDMEKTLRHAGLPVDVSVYDGDICLYSDDPEADIPWKKEKGWYIDGGKFFTIYDSKRLGYTMIIRTPYKELQDSIRAVHMRSILLSVLAGAAALAFSSILIKMVIRDLYGLIEKMDDFGAGKRLDENGGKLYQKRTDEIGKMYRHFYRMASDYRKLMEEDYNNKLLLKEAEFVQLQKQIQPHFLFNTLTAIGWMAYSHEDVETANMVEALVRMMRTVTDSSQALVPVGNDLQMVQDYLFIQKFRFRSRLQTEICISPETRELLIPRISIQPLVENAVTYAMEELISECRIRIFDRSGEGCTEIVVEDNGPGFPEDILEKLESGERKAKGSGTALRNIDKRLRYTFSEEYGLSFHRMENGMQVILRIPDGICRGREQELQGGL